MRACASRKRCDKSLAGTSLTVKHAAGKPGSVDFVEGRGGLPMVSLKHKCGSSAEVRTRSQN